jgi:hypothetical protein
VLDKLAERDFQLAEQIQIKPPEHRATVQGCSDTPEIGPNRNLVSPFHRRTWRSLARVGKGMLPDQAPPSRILGDRTGDTASRSGAGQAKALDTQPKRIWRGGKALALTAESFFGPPLAIAVLQGPHAECQRGEIERL